jgi:hypothetical protein
MTKIVCVTSMDKLYYDKIGKLMIESWSTHWPEDCKLLVYQEGFEIEKFDRVTGVSWEDKCYDDWLEFSKKARGPGIRFAKKGYTMISAMETVDCDLLIWCDADTVTYKKFPKDKILSILPSGKLIGFFDTYYQHNKVYSDKEYINPKRPTSAAESGFVVINKNHKEFDTYSVNYKKLYKLPSPTPELGPWYDGNVCAVAAKNLREYVEDLSKLRTRRKTQTPINHCWIGEYVRHKKAKQKNNIDIEKLREQIGVNK